MVVKEVFSAAAACWSNRSTQHLSSFPSLTIWTERSTDWMATKKRYHIESTIFAGHCRNSNQLVLQDDWTGEEFQRRYFRRCLLYAIHPIKEINNNKPEKANYETGSLSQIQILSRVSSIQPIQSASHGFHLIGELYTYFFFLKPRMTHYTTERRETERLI